MNSVASYTSNVLASMVAASTLTSTEHLQVPTSAIRMDAEESSSMSETNVTTSKMVAVSEIEIDAKSFFKDGIKRSGTSMSLHMNGELYPRVVLSHFSDIEVPELGVKLSATDFTEERLHKLIWCKFLTLEDSAKLEELDEGGRTLLNAYGKYFDYARYRAETAPLVKVFGKLISNSKDGVTVKWVGGEEEKLRGNLAEQVSVLEDNPIRNFSALARFVGYKLSYIEDVRPDSDASLSNNDLSWMTEWQNG